MPVHITVQSQSVEEKLPSASTKPFMVSTVTGYSPVTASTDLRTNKKQKNHHHVIFHHISPRQFAQRRPGMQRNQNSVRFTSAIKLGPVTHTVPVALMITAGFDILDPGHESDQLRLPGPRDRFENRRLLRKKKGTWKSRTLA